MEVRRIPLALRLLPRIRQRVICFHLRECASYEEWAGMQAFTVKACISDTGSYLRPLLKLDNLPLIYKHVSGNVLHAILALPN